MAISIRIPRTVWPPTMQYNSPQRLPTHYQSKRFDNGFSLIELMIVVSLLSIVLAVAVPSFTQLTTNNRSYTLSKELIALLNFARSTAITQRAIVVVCPNNNEWVVKRSKCNATEPLRVMALPAHATLSTQNTEFTYHYNGTSSTGRIVVCTAKKPESGYIIDLRSTGSARIYERGQKPKSDDPTKYEDLEGCTV